MLMNLHCILIEWQSQGYQLLTVRLWGFQVRHPRCVEYKLKYNIKNYIYNTVIHNFSLLDYIRL